MEQWKYNNTYSGTPQGAVLSPLFANISGQLDKFVEKAHTPENTRGKQRARNHEKLLTLEHTTPKERGS